MLHLLKRKKGAAGAFAMAGGGALALLALLALLFAGCNTDGDTGDSGGSSGGGNGSEDTGGSSADSHVDQTGTDRVDTINGTYYVYSADGLKKWVDYMETEKGSYNVSCTLRSCIIFGEDDEWDPIATNFVDAYQATFNGNGHTISNLKINNTGTAGINCTGFLGVIGTNGKVRNLTLETPSVSGAISYVGGIAGYNNGGTIENCTVSGGTVTGSSSCVGGIAGYNTSTVSGCENSATVSGSDDVGGIVGRNSSNGTVTGCDNSGGSVTSNASGTNIGAVVGNNSGTVEDCTWLSSTADKGIGGGTDDGATFY